MSNGTPADRKAAERHALPLPVPGAVRSAIEGLAWPALPGAGALPQFALLFALEQTQWWSPERLRAHQFLQLALLIRHAGATVPYYRALFARLGVDANAPLSEENWARLPILTRRDLQESFDALKSERVPASHGTTAETFSSGSTGMPVKAVKTGLQQLFWNAFAMRDHLWHRRDLSGRLAIIRAHRNPEAGAYPDGKHQLRWGKASEAFATGPSFGLNILTKVHLQAEWLSRIAPDYLLTFPSNLEALAKHCLEHRIALPTLREVHTISEVLRPEVREACRTAFGVEVVDLYSADEVGYIAIQSPASQQLLVQAEANLVEILDEENRPCAPGQIGRVVVTPLHSFAMPLLRYAIGDYAEAGGPAACGRGLPTINRVLGRARNMVRLPNGHRHYANYNRMVEGFDKIIQFQIVRRTEEGLEMRLVARAPLDPSEEDALRARIRERFAYPFVVDFSYCSEIARGPGGKFLDFVSEVD